jgi:hypothetical protein
VPINLAVEDVSAKAAYSNGILELKIKLKQASILPCEDQGDLIEKLK